MTKPTVTRSTVGAPVDKKSAVSGVMSGISRPKPMMIPAASRAWTTTTSGSTVPPIWASCQRSNARNTTPWDGSTCAVTCGVVVVPVSGMGPLQFGARLGGGGVRIGQGEVGVLEGGRGERVALDRTVLVTAACPRDGTCSGVVRDGQECSAVVGHTSGHREGRLNRVSGGIVVALRVQAQLQPELGV